MTGPVSCRDDSSIIKVKNLPQIKHKKSDPNLQLLPVSGLSLQPQGEMLPAKVANCSLLPVVQWLIFKIIN